MNAEILRSIQKSFASFVFSLALVSFLTLTFKDSSINCFRMTFGPTPLTGLIKSKQQNSRTYCCWNLSVRLFFISKECIVNLFKIFVYLVYFFTQTFYLVSLDSLSSDRKGQSIISQLHIVIDRFQKIIDTVQLHEKNRRVSERECRSISLTSIIKIKTVQAVHIRETERWQRR